MQVKSHVVIYHDNCPDGFTAAWAAHKVFKDNALYLPANYGQQPHLDVCRGMQVYLVDFTYPRVVLDQIAVVATSVHVYDHHKTAEADLKDWKGGHVVFDMKRSGAGITWDELCQSVRCNLINYVEDRDLWLWKVAWSREVNEYLFSLDRTFEHWDLAFHNLDSDFHLEKIVEIGRTLLRTKRVRVAKVCENVRHLLFQGQVVKIPVVNTAWDFSEIGEHLCEQFPYAPCAGYYFDRKDLRQWGFRSRGVFDVSVLCKQFGGGGHKAAAGFTSEIGWLPS